MVSSSYRTLEALGPEHEFALVDENLKCMPIADRVIKDVRGRVANSIEFRDFTVSKELQMHVLEVKPNSPFTSLTVFEERMYSAVLEVADLLGRRYGCRLLGTGMHPTLRLSETSVWSHRHRQIYEAFGKIFDLMQHGWLNIQSFQLNLSYSDASDAVLMHNLLAYVCAYLPAITASSPIYEGVVGEYLDNRLYFYKEAQKEVPSVAGDVVPEYISSLEDYRRKVIERYSIELAKAGADSCILYKEWVNSRGVILRSDRRALEIRVMDEQECVRSDVALSAFIRALLRGLMNEGAQLLPRRILVHDFNSVIKFGLSAEVHHPLGSFARNVCQHLLRTALSYATDEEKEYLLLVQKRVECGSLSESIRKRVMVRAQKTSLKEAIIDVYSSLSNCLIRNEPFF